MPSCQRSYKSSRRSSTRINLGFRQRLSCLLGLAVILALAITTSACRHSTQDLRGPRFKSIDPQTLWVDAASPSNRFDGSGGSLLPGPGWAPPEGDGGSGKWGNFAWVSDRQALLWFNMPFDESLDFYALCRPSPGPPGAKQTLTLLLDQAKVGETSLTNGWQSVRITLPPIAGGVGLHTLELKFSRVTRPKDIGLNADSRALAAAFSTVALVPRSVPSPEDFLNREFVSGQTGKISIPLGGAAAMPLPAGTHLVFRIAGAEESDCKGCRLRIAQIDPSGGLEALWGGSLRAARHLSLPVSSSPGGVSRLVLRPTPPAADPKQTQGSIILGLADNYLRVERERTATSGKAAKPDIFIYLVDTLRADSLADYGGPSGLTPEMNHFARRAAVEYLGVRAPSAWTLPCVASILTGVYPFHHHLMQGTHRLDPVATPPLAQRLSELGYDTVGFSQSYIASSSFGLSSGFGTFFLNNELNNAKLRSQNIRKMLLSWLFQRGTDSRPMFAYIQTVDPHAPYAPPPGFRGYADRNPGKFPASQYTPKDFMEKRLASSASEVAHLRGLYDGEVHYTDEEFGRFLDLLHYLGLYDRSFVILLSDHGEEFGEHNGFDHGRTLYDELLRVPLLIKFPGNRWAGMRIDKPVSSLDIAPTLLSYLGKDRLAASLDGMDISPEALARRSHGQRPLYAEVNPLGAPMAGPVDLRALIVRDFKCIQSLTKVNQFGKSIPEWRGFDLRRDPGEHSPVPQDSSNLSRCSHELLHWLELEKQRGSPSPKNEKTTEDALRKLKALGYIQ